MSFQNDRLAIVSHRRARVSCSCADEQQEDECGERASHPHLDIQPTASKDIRTESISISSSKSVISHPTRRALRILATRGESPVPALLKLSSSQSVRRKARTKDT